MQQRLPRQRGVTLVELVIAIAIIGVAMAGVLGTFALASRYNADPVIRKQALAIAESLMDEILSRPFTTCDPYSYDPTTQNCSLNGSVFEGIGPETLGGVVETRTGAQRFDNVNDYDGYSRPAGAYNDGNSNTGMEDVLGNRPEQWKPYSVSVSVRALDGSASYPSLGPAGMTVPDTETLLVTVTVTGPGPTVIQLDGVRARYDPAP